MDTRRAAVLMACIACKLATLVVAEFLQDEGGGGTTGSGSGGGSGGTAAAVISSQIITLVQAFQGAAAAAWLSVSNSERDGGDAASIEGESGGCGGRKRRRMSHEWWVKPRSSSWANRVFAGLVDTATHRVHFRMSPASLEWLCRQVGPLVERMDTHYRQCVPVQRRVAMALFRLASGAKYSVVADKFGLGESTAFICTRQLCEALCTRFKRYLAFPGPEGLAKVAAGFERHAKLPNCCGAIDCTRFKIRRPAGPYSGDYYDGNLYHSIVAQIVADSDSRILNIAAGFAGGTSDTRVLRLSTLYNDTQSQKLLNGAPAQLAGFNVPQYLVGDTGYPFLPWLLLPYEDTDMLSHQAAFNRKHSIARLPVLRAFASLRKWKIFDRAMSVDVKTAVSMIGACSILHNMLLLRGEPLDLEDEKDFSIYEEASQYSKDYTEEEDDISSNDILAFHVRDALAIGTYQSGNS